MKLTECVNNTPNTWVASAPRADGGTPVVTLGFIREELGHMPMAALGGARARCGEAQNDSSGT